jgi:hypothetical protein
MTSGLGVLALRFVKRHAMFERVDHDHWGAGAADSFTLKLDRFTQGLVVVKMIEKPLWGDRVLRDGWSSSDGASCVAFVQL